MRSVFDIIAVDVRMQAVSVLRDILIIASSAHSHTYRYIVERTNASNIRIFSTFTTLRTAWATTARAFVSSGNAGTHIE